MQHVTTLEELATLPAGTIYATTINGAPRYCIRSDMPRGMGDTIHHTIEEAEQEQTRERARKADREQWRARHEQEEREQAERDRLLNDSFRGFLFSSPMQFGRAKTVLLRSVRNRGRVITRKALIEERIEAGAIVTANGLENADGSFLPADSITSIGLQYAAHILAQTVTQ
jgi:hypothetical protein